MLKGLSFLPFEDPLLVRDSNDVCAFLKCCEGSSVSVFSLDVKELFFSLPQASLLETVRDRIDEVGVVPFQNKIGYSPGGFLELLRTYFQSLMVNFEGSRYNQKDGICIRAVIAPVLSDMLFAKCDKEIESTMLGSKMKRILRYVDDYLIIGEAKEEDKKATFAKQALSTFQECACGLSFTIELPVEGRIRFLDLVLSEGEGSICWFFEPRASKGTVLPFSSEHSKLVKRGIATSCMGRP